MTYTLATKQSVQAQNHRDELPGGDVRPIVAAAKPSSVRSRLAVDGAVGLAAGTRHRMLTIASLVLLASCGDAALADVDQPAGPPSTQTAAGLRIAGITADSLTEISVKSGDSLSQAITAQLVDAAGSAVPQSGVRVSVALTTVSGAPLPGARIVSADTAVTSADGVATFRGLTVSGPASTGRLMFAAPALAPVRLAIRLTAGAASTTASAVTVLPDSVPVGGASQVVITLLDAVGNRIGAGQTVAVALSGGTSTATPSAPVFNTADSTYRLTLTGVTAGTATTVTATVDGRALAATRQLTIVTPVVSLVPATRLAFTLLPGDTTTGIVVRSGSTLAQAVAELRSATNTTVAQGGVSIFASLTNPLGGVLTGGTITGAGPVSTSSNGSATFPAIGVSGRVGQARVQMTSPGLAGLSFPITIAAGSASAGSSTLTISADTVPVGSASVVTVIPRDAQSNLLGAGQTVSVTATGGTATGAVGAVSFTAGDSSYRATFTGTAVGTATTVRAVAAGVSLTQSRTVRVTAGPVSAGVSALTASADSIPIGGSSVVTITPRDAAGNKRGAGLVVSVTATGGTSVGSLSAVAYTASDSSYRSTFSGTTAGTALTVRATVTGVALTATRLVTVRAAAAPPPPPPPPPGDTTWTFCSNPGAFCENFTGLHTVRLVASSGQFVTQDAFGRIVCHQPSFSAQLPPGSTVSRCDVGRLRTEVITNPSPGMSGFGATVTVPMGDPGQGVALIRPSTSQPGVLTFEGNFRMSCGFTKFGFFDPIVFPDQPFAGHLHMFFGNAGVTGTSTTQSILNSGNSTCHGGTANRTGYWFPAVYDAVTQEIQIPSRGTFYYKSHILPPEGLQPIPAGLRMIAGNKNATGYQSVADWYCSRTNIPNTEGFIPNCPVGDEVMLSVAFPECWNGRDLDSPDHQSHMAYAIYVNGGTSYCPSTHPIGLPRVEEIVAFPVTANSRPLQWRLSSDMYSSSIRGGRSLHADWMDGWTRDAMTTFTRECVNRRRDSTLQLCDGRDLYYVP